MAQVHIVGAGPAGAVAAISAQRAGHDVTISEEHPASGSPCNCSGLFSKDGLASLEKHARLGNVKKNDIFGADIHLGRECIRVRRKNPVAFVCDRTAIDSRLVSEAERLGASVNYREKVKGKFRSGNIIGSDGPLSLVARHFGFPEIRKFASTFQAEMPYMSEDPRIVEVFLSQSFPGFFAWVIPKDECSAEFGAGALVPHDAHSSFRNLLKMKKAEYRKPRGWLIPLEQRRRTSMSSGRYKVLLAGDAAGQVKATTGGGVVFGSACAHIAGMHATNPLRYETWWRLRYGPDLAIHGLIHSYLSRRSDEGLSMLGRRLKKMNCEQYLSEHGHMDSPTRMMGPGLFVHILKNIAGVA